ncbi:zinc finger protein with KRAB and SCAN domains 8-like [Sceloporus undulatus]|uniref:zinc finger protein with KRAB and SCAN domains 8-like n=1 Tax=Sceloporus undulatus TaxID=8520 RepID=UPI001C4D3331|nr:zinc finger protein with KRAB and SCAN domains 8-like [Sceloporus undulatus]
MEDQGSEEGQRPLRTAPHVLQAVIIGDNLQRIPVAQIKQEPVEGQLQQWETQWQTFLKTVEAPQTGWMAVQLPEEPPPWDDTQAFLTSFEQVAEACRWPKEVWATRLLPALQGEAERAYSRMEVRDREDYGKVKVAILQGDVLRREKNRQHFRCFCYREDEGPRGAYSQLQELCHRWLKVEKHTKEQILEDLILEQLLTILPPEVQSWVRERGPGSCSEAVALAEDFLRRQQEANKWEQQILTKFVEPAVRSVKAKAAPSDRGETQLRKETKARHKPDASLMDCMPANNCEEKTVEHPKLNESREEVLQYSELSVGREKSLVCSKMAKPDVAPQIRTPKNVTQISEEGKISWDPHSSKRQQRNHSKNDTKDSIPGVENKTFGERLLENARHPESLREYSGLFECEAANNRGETLQHAKCSKNVSLYRDPLINQQQNMHASEKPHKCSYVGKATCQIFHEGTHAEKTPFQCSTCGKCFSRNSLLLKHERTHRGEKAYTCPTCGKSFVYSWNLIKHKKKHTGEKPHQCSACGKTFFERSDLLRHERTHTGEKPYRCTHCWRHFSQKWLLIKHERTHTG